MSEGVVVSDGLAVYTTRVNETPAGFVIFVVVYVGLSFLLLIPVALWKRRKSKTKDHESDYEDEGQELVRLDTRPNSSSVTAQLNSSQNTCKVEGEATVSTGQTNQSVVHQGLPSHGLDLTISKLSLVGHGNREADHESPMQGPEGTQTPPMKRASPSLTSLEQAVSSEFVPGGLLSSRALGRFNNRSVVSAATTTQVRASGVSRRSAAQSARRRPLDRVRDMSANLGWTTQPAAQKMRRFVQAERLSQAASEEGSAASREPSWTSRQGLRSPHPQPRGPASVAASRALAGEAQEGEADFYRQRYVERSRRQRMQSSGAASELSFMPPLSSGVLAPEDAADADDPGRAPMVRSYRIAPPPQPGGIGDPSRGILSRCTGFLDIVDLDYDMLRVLQLALPSILGAVADPFMRLVLIAVISYYIDTPSMVAFVLVIIFVRLSTVEISGAITDAETTMIQIAHSDGGEAAFFLTGQWMQMALIFQVLIGVPMMVIWAYLIDNLVRWLLSSTAPVIADLAGSYTQVIVIGYQLSAMTKTFMAPFRMNGPPPFEIIIDVATSVLTMITIGIVIAVEAGIGQTLSLVAVGWVQVVLMAVNAICKVSIVLIRGWFQPYQRGFFGRFVLREKSEVLTFFGSAFPLFIGSLIELGEWELLTLFVRALGPGEVVSWAVMGVVWEVFAASTTGLGNAASVRVSYYLSENEPVLAKRLAQKAIFLAAVQGFAFGSILLLLAPDISVVLTSNPVLQNALNNLMGLTAVANFTMNFAQVYWSLVGATTRFGLATAWILACRWFLIFPLAAICVYGYEFDNSAVTGTIAVGYGTAAFTLACVVISTDWRHWCMKMREDSLPHDASADLGGGGVDENGEQCSDSDDIL